VLEYECRVPRDAIPPTPPGPEGSNGNGLVRVQRGARLWSSPVSARRVSPDRSTRKFV